MFAFLGAVALLSVVAGYLYFRKHKAAVEAAAALLKSSDKVGPSPVAPVTTPAPLPEAPKPEA
jgi:hypothetical protein